MENNKLPLHVGIIMDGNGRWAKAQGKNRLVGHREGVESVRVIVESAKKFGVKYLTLYAFSTENWKRATEEVNGLMLLFEQFLKSEKKLMLKENIRLRIIGKEEGVSDRLLRVIKEVEEATYVENPSLELNIAFNYGGRAEIVDAVNKMLKSGIEKISEEEFNKYLYNTTLPDPELIIRTSGEYRTSNFLLWQSAYSEYYITDMFWPEFRETQFKEALDIYMKRDRRFGGVKTDEK